MIRSFFKVGAGILVIAILVGVGYVSVNLFSRTTARQKTAIAVQGTTTASADQTVLPPKDTSGWQQYTDKNFGFSIAYPSDWKTDKKDREHPASVFTITHPGASQKDDVDVAVRVLTTPSFGALEEKLQPQAKLIKNKSMVTINGQEAMAITIGDTDLSLYLYFQKDGRLYNLIFYKAASMEALGAAEKGILFSFSFTN